MANITRWAPPPPLVPDLNDPLFAEFLAIPIFGTGLNLTPRQIALLGRVSPAERHARASEIYSKLGLLQARLRPDRPDLTVNNIIDQITDADFLHTGMTRETLPKFASGGKKSVITATIDNNGHTAPISVFWSQAMSTARFTAHIATLPALQMSPFITQTTFECGKMSLKVNTVLGFKNFEKTVMDTVKCSPEFKDLDKSLGKYGAYVLRIMFQYQEEEGGAFKTFLVLARGEDDSLKRAINVMRRLEVGRYQVSVGMDMQ
ncbi:hypothetical protein ACEPPN_009162 [Leptodophora sp. 'Broadleaf-Isolate-01']